MRWKGLHIILILLLVGIGLPVLAQPSADYETLYDRYASHDHASEGAVLDLLDLADEYGNQYPELGRRAAEKALVYSRELKKDSLYARSMIAMGMSYRRLSNFDSSFNFSRHTNMLKKGVTAETLSVPLWIYTMSIRCEELPKKPPKRLGF